ncbi:MAG: hypothetical protein QOE33_2464 [Acidobacteriota bacterium]|nr:hypothetical protein [Acidobacteriota bacterium]
MAETLDVRRHIRATLNGMDRRLGLRQWLWRDADAGAELRFMQSDARDPFTSLPALEHPRPNTVLDIGGNHGQFAKEMFRVFPGATVYSFEPLPECYAELRALAALHPELHPIHVAISDETGERDFWVSRFRDSSSMQEMLPSHVEAWPNTEVEAKITVRAETLDAVASQLKLVPPVLAKLDIQGHELAAIAGGRETLARCQRVMLECNFAPLYKGQPTFVELYDAMRSLGFLFDGFIVPLRHPRTHELLSADAVFYRPAPLSL